MCRGRHGDSRINRRLVSDTPKQMTRSLRIAATTIVWVSGGPRLEHARRELAAGLNHRGSAGMQSDDRNMHCRSCEIRGRSIDGGDWMAGAGCPIAGLGDAAGTASALESPAGP